MKREVEKEIVKEVGGCSMKKVSRRLLEWVAICNILKEKQEEDQEWEGRTV